MSVTFTAVVGVMSKLVGAGLKIYGLSQKGLLELDKDLEAIEATLTASGQVSTLFPPTTSIRIQARWIAITCSAFGEAWNQHFRGLLALDRKPDDVTAHLEAAVNNATQGILPLGDQSLSAQVKLTEALSGDPLQLPIYRALWAAFRQRGLGQLKGKPGSFFNVDKIWQKPLIDLSDPPATDPLPAPPGIDSLSQLPGMDRAALQLRFENTYRLAYREAMASPYGREVRAFLAGIHGDIGEWVRYRLVQEAKTWGQRPVLGKAVTAWPKLLLDDIYVEPMAIPRTLTSGPTPVITARPVRTLIREHLAGKDKSLVVVAGDFGHGKSLTARMLACEQAHKYLNSVEPAAARHVPLYIRLGVGNHKSALPSMVQAALFQQRARLELQLKEDHIAFAMPEANRCMLFLLDGLDELSLSQSEQEQMFTDLLGQATPQHQIVVFARPAALPLRWLGTNQVSVLELKNFSTAGDTGGQVGDWLRRWHKCSGATTEEAADRARVQFARLSEQNLLGLAVTPILLQMIARTWSQADPAIPQPSLRLADLYEQFLQQIARGKLDVDEDEHDRIAAASKSLRASLAARPGCQLRPEKLGLSEDAEPVAAMLWLMSRVAWLSLCVEQRRQAAEKNLCPKSKQTLEDQLDALLSGELGFDDASSRSLVKGGLLLTLQTSFVKGEMYRPLFGHTSFRDFLVARYWDHQLRQLLSGEETSEDASPLLGGRFLESENVRLSFLRELLIDWSNQDLRELAAWAQRTLDDERIATGGPDALTARADQRVYLREAALAIGSVIRADPRTVMIPRQAWTLRSLLGTLWLRGEVGIIRAEDSILSQSWLDRAEMQGADLSRATLSGANLQGANLQGAHLTGALLDEVNLEHAVLREADLHQVRTMRKARLQNANLQYANLEYAYMQHASLEGADLKNANLQNAHLEGTDLRATILTGANLRDATYDSTTTWPLDFDYASTGAKLSEPTANPFEVPPETTSVSTP